MKVGRTIAQEWEKQESESERLANRKKSKTKKVIKVLSVFACLAIVTVLATMGITKWFTTNEKVEKEKTAIVPTVQIIDENGAGISNRMKEYVGTIEKDLQDLGYTVNRAVIPAGKSREVDVFLNNYEYYFKLNIDRASAVSAEDVSRMVAYLSEHGINPGYVDVRVKGKGYYK
ncbi:hypothetical protein IKE88_02755 [Candidatus Saccharibacteria bacterium]|nr:hypothetical protein [Candidatus Saccharibacteria bacterium]